ncbi:MAG: hypothetical protein ACE5HN_02040 [Nitrospiria bacterium]
MTHEVMGGKDFNKRDSIDIRACTCGSIHLSFFGRTTFHLSHEEFLEFAGGVAQVSATLKHVRKEDPLITQQGNGLNH